MATLDELLGDSLLGDTENPPGGATLDELSSYFSTSHLVSQPDPSTPTKDPYEEFDKMAAKASQNISRDQRNWALDMAASGTWSFLDTFTFGLAGWVTPDEFEEKYLMPQTTAGSVAAAIGGTAGFVVGAPMKLGAKAAQALARPAMAAAGRTSVRAAVKKSAKKVLADPIAKESALFSSKASKDLMFKDIRKRVSQESMKARWDQAGAGVAKNWADKSSKAIRQITDDAVKRKVINDTEAKLIRDVFNKNLTTRPLHDIVDVVMLRNPNKFGFVTGSMIHEAAMFGMIDAALEGVHSAPDLYGKEGKAYDYTAPLWGMGIGAAFGALKLLPAAGKQSVTSEDFKSGVKAVF